MWKWLTALSVCFLAPGYVGAQDEIIKDLSTEHVEKFIREVMKAAKFSRSQTGDVILYATPPGFFDVVFDRGAKTVSFQYSYRDLKADRAKIEEWNGQPDNISRARLAKDGTITFSGVVSYEKGISIAKLEATHVKLKQEEEAFRTFLQGKEPPVVAKSKDVVTQFFPAGVGKDEKDAATRWEIDWDFAENPVKTVHLLRIVSAKFHFKDRNKQWKSVVIARNIELVEAFAPYDDSMTSFLDLANRNRADRTIVAMNQLKGPTCVAETKIVPWSKNTKLTIYKEVHDDGIRWIHGGKDGPVGENGGYRGQKLVLRSVFQAGNYVYMVEYHFTDDGRIVPRLGFTGYNYFHRGFGSPRSVDGKKPVPTDDGDVHLHVGCWRMEFDLGSPQQNDYQIVRRYFDAKDKRFRVSTKSFNDGKEGKALWSAEEFTTLRIVSGTQKSLVGQPNERPIACELIPTRQGSVRNLVGHMDVANANMDFINYDFWVTRKPVNTTPFHEIPKFAQQRQLKGERVAVWYNAPALHVPRGEDFGPDGRTRNGGVALTTWIEFTLRPRDLFDSTPLFP